MSAAAERALRKQSFRYADGIVLAEAARQGIAVPEGRLDPTNPQHAGLIALWSKSRAAFVAVGGVPVDSKQRFVDYPTEGAFAPH